MDTIYKIQLYIISGLVICLYIIVIDLQITIDRLKTDIITFKDYENLREQLTIRKRCHKWNKIEKEKND